VSEFAEALLWLVMALHPFDTVRHAVLALGYLQVSEDEHRAQPMRNVFRVQGTGFLIRPHLVMTCAHVISDVRGLMKKKGVPEDRPQLMLVLPKPGEPTVWRVEYRRMRSYREFKEYDIGFVELSETDGTDRSVPLVGSADISVGEAVAVCGYPHGSAVLGGKEVERYGPILQQGHVAAIIPYDGPNHVGLVIDFPVGGGMSGGPVFRASTGELVGIVDRANETLTFAISLPPTRRQSLLAAFDQEPGARVVPPLQIAITEARRDPTKVSYRRRRRS
jgi:hypothetical protein